MNTRGCRGRLDDRHDDQAFCTVPRKRPNFFLLILAAIWAGILAGFVQDIFEHFTGKHVSYAIVVHLHAVTFVGWLVLVTTQVTLVRSGRVDLHRRLGVAAVVMIPLMLVLGPVTSLIMGKLELPTPDGDAPFLIVPFVTIGAFAALASAGIVLRRDSPAHRRLMLLATIALADAGFSRWLGPSIAKAMGSGVAPFFVQEYFGSVLLIGAMIVYDLATRRRLHPAVAAAMVFCLTTEVIASVIYNLPAWKPIATRLLA